MPIFPVWIRVSASQSSSSCRTRRGRSRTLRPPSRTSPCARRSDGRSARCRTTGSVPCSKRQLDAEPHREAAGLLATAVRRRHPAGPPPVTTANPASAKARPVARALSYVGVPPGHGRSRRSRPRAGRSSRPPGSPRGTRRRSARCHLTIDESGSPKQAAVELALLGCHRRSCGTWAAIIPTTRATATAPDMSASVHARRRARPGRGRPRHAAAAGTSEG